VADRDPLPGLTELGRVGEDSAQPLPVVQVRRLGDRRRARRHAGMLAAAVTAVMIAGGTVLSQGMLQTDRAPDPAQTPTTVPTVVTASPTPTRTVTEANLIMASEVPGIERERFVETPAGVGRDDDHLTTCVPDGEMDQLGATATAGRSFRMDRRSDGETNPPAKPFDNEPTLYTQAVQFDSTAAAEKAYLIYRDWLDSCPQTIKERGDTALGGGVGWTPVSTSVNGAKAGFDEIVWRAASDGSEAGYFESIGLTRVDDRLAVTVWLVYGQDYNVSLDPKGDPDTGLPAHPQFGLLKAAAQHLD
jgi:hypothetical protein